MVKLGKFPGQIPILTWHSFLMNNQTKTHVMNAKNSMAGEMVVDNQAEVESFESESRQLLTSFTAWHAGWIVTEVPRYLLVSFSLPALFHSIAWEDSDKNLVLVLVPEGVDPKTSPVRVLIAGVINIQFCPSSLSLPEHIVCLEMENGETLIIRLELHLDRRRIYEQYYGQCSE